jgi:hypothetical protein
MESIAAVMEMIDTIKDRIDEGTYLSVCNEMKKIYESNEKVKVNEDARAMSLRIAYTLPMYKDRLKLKKDRKVTICYGTINNTIIPKMLLLNGTPAIFKQYCEDEQICIWTINRYLYNVDAPTIEVRHHIGIRDEPKNEDCSVSIKYEGVTHLKYKDCNVKPIVNSVYNN